jgi:hypothetical protein
MNQFVQLVDQHSGFALVALTAAYVLTTVALFVLSYRQFRFAMRLEENRIKPSLVLDLVKDGLAVNVTLKNLGQTVAHAIKISVDPPIRALYGGAQAVPTLERDEGLPFIENGIESLVPGGEIQGLVGFWPRFSSHYRDLRFRGEISYRDHIGRRYTEPFVIDLSGERGLGHVRRYEIHDVAKELQEIRKLLDHIATGYRKPLVRVITEKEHQRNEEAALEEAIREAQDSRQQ